MHEILEWIMRPMAKTNSSTLQNDVTIHNCNLKCDMDLCYPLPSTVHDSLYHDPLGKSIPSSILSRPLDFRVTSSNCDQVQGSHITQKMSKKVRKLSIFPLCFEIFHVKAMSFRS